MNKQPWKVQPAKLKRQGTYPKDVLNDLELSMLPIRAIDTMCAAAKRQYKESMPGGAIAPNYHMLNRMYQTMTETFLASKDNVHYTVDRVVELQVISERYNQLLSALPMSQVVSKHKQALSIIEQAVQNTYMAALFDELVASFDTKLDSFQESLVAELKGMFASASMAINKSDKE